jgi:hypothetical protein
MRFPIFNNASVLVDKFVAKRNVLYGGDDPDLTY